MSGVQGTLFPALCLPICPGAQCLPWTIIGIHVTSAGEEPVQITPQFVEPGKDLETGMPLTIQVLVHIRSWHPHCYGKRRNRTVGCHSELPYTISERTHNRAMNE